MSELMSTALSENDLQLIRHRLETNGYDPKANPVDIESKLGSDGKFTDLDYNDNSVGWKTEPHLGRVLSMIKAAYTPDNPRFGDAELKKKIVAGLSFWASGKWTPSANWWYTTIGCPSRLRNILVFPIEGLADSDKQALIAMLNPGLHELEETNCPPEYRERKILTTGANLLDILQIGIMKATVSGDKALLERYHSYLENELRIFPDHTKENAFPDAEGLKSDGSFHQHNDLIYNAGYGEVFVSGVINLALLFEGTPLALSSKAISNLAFLLLEGNAWMLRGGIADFSVHGRGISRVNAGKGFGKAVSALASLLIGQSNISQKDKQNLQLVLDTRMGAQDKGMNGYKYFWASDYASLQRPTFQIGIHSSSLRMKPHECMNGENLLGLYLGSGVTWIRMSGDEYFNLQPVLDWNYLPGTTVLPGRLKPYDVKKGSGYYTYGKTSFVGGVSDGVIGISVLDLAHEGVEGHKAWFLFDEGMLILGAGMKAQGDVSMVTTLNQTRFRGAVVYGFTDGSSNLWKAGEALPTEVTWVLHDNVSYFPEKNATLQLTATEGRGKWKDINNQGPKDEVVDNVFRLSMEHSAPSFSYSVLPGLPSRQATEWQKKLSSAVIQNTEDLQQVRIAETELLVFWKAARARLASGVVVEASQPMLMLVHQNNNQLSFDVSDPTHLLTRVEWTVSEALRGVKKSPRGSLIQTELPWDNEKGRTQHLSYEIETTQK